MKNTWKALENQSTMLIDAGPLVALSNPLDPHHEVCAEIARSIHAAPVTTWPAITEAAWILRAFPRSFEGLARSFITGELRIYEMNSEALPWVVAFMRQYSTIRAQLADASLMYVAEKENIDDIFTLDRRDFSVYRTSRHRALNIFP